MILTGSNNPAIDFDCPKHGIVKAFAREILGRVLPLSCDLCAEEQRQAKSAEKIRSFEKIKADKVATLLQRTCIPKRFLERSFENYRAETDNQRKALHLAKLYADKFEDRLKYGGGLAFCGKPGTGKTHLATAIANKIIRTGRTAVFATVLDICRSIKSTYNKNSSVTEREAIRYYTAPDLLIMDEVGMQFGTDAEKLIVCEIMNNRYGDVKPTIVLSNLPEDQLGDYLGVRVIDRLKEGGGVVVAFDWDSYRSRVHKDADLPAASVEPVNWERV